jgi:class 3 adenylate cyclase
MRSKPRTTLATTGDVERRAHMWARRGRRRKAGDTAPVLAEIEWFLREPETAATPDRVLATVLFTDIVASTEQLAASGDNAWGRALDEHDRTMGRLVASYRVRVVKSTGDGILATFSTVPLGRCVARPR